MTIDVSRGSAKIYEFPARGRFAVSAKDDVAPAANLVSQRAAKVVYGGGWYHDEAIEADRTRKN